MVSVITTWEYLKVFINSLKQNINKKMTHLLNK